MNPGLSARPTSSSSSPAFPRSPGPVMFMGLLIVAGPAFPVAGVSAALHVLSGSLNYVAYAGPSTVGNNPTAMSSQLSS